MQETLSCHEAEEDGFPVYMVLDGFRPKKTSFRQACRKIPLSTKKPAMLDKRRSSFVQQSFSFSAVGNGSDMFAFERGTQVEATILLIYNMLLIFYIHVVPFLPFCFRFGDPGRSWHVMIWFDLVQCWSEACCPGCRRY